MTTNIIKIPMNYKNSNDPFIINAIQITLPSYVKERIAKYVFTVEEGTIYLHRKCNTCKKFIKVLVYEDGNFSKINNSEIDFKSPSNGFNTCCNKCLKTNPVKTISPSSQNHNIDTTVQLNIKVDVELKKYYRKLAAEKNTKLNTELINALIFYKSHRK